MNEIAQQQDIQQWRKRTKDKTLMSKVNEEDQVQVQEGMVRKIIEPESVMPHKLRKEGHLNLFIWPNIGRIFTIGQALLQVLKIYLQKKL